MVSVASTQLCHFFHESSHRYINGHDYFNKTLFIKQMAGQIWPVGSHFLAPALEQCFANSFDYNHQIISQWFSSLDYYSLPN